MVDILALMAEGAAVALHPYHAELNTYKAAEYLNVSRPFLIRLLEEGKIPFHKVGTHRRVKFSDLREYKQENQAKRLEALDEMTRLNQSMGLY